MNQGTSYFGGNAHERRNVARATAQRLFLEQPDLTNRDVAERLGVHHNTVAEWRRQLREAMRK